MSVALYAHALRAMRLRQLRGRLREPLAQRRFPLPRVPRTFRPVVDVAPLWRSPAFAGSEDVLGDEALDILGLVVPYTPSDWQLPGELRLRRFHLHYGDEVLGFARRDEPASARRALEAWIDGNPPRAGDAWHPYVVSTRVCNWIAALTLAPELAEARVVESLQRQVVFLMGNVEDGVLGNHVIRNACALVLGGRAFGDGGVLRRGLSLLDREVPEQVLADGGHYERSPVYHLVVMRDLQVARAAAGLEQLDEPLDRMARFAAALSRPDGAPALFNDGPLDFAPQLELPEPPQGVSAFPETGYVIVREDDLWLAFDCGPPAPGFLPAHAHADALSLQLWLEGRPVLVDAGTYTYEAGGDRDWFRGTRAHSTVCVGGRDQFELWGAFRSGPLPSVRLEHAGDRELVGSAVYRGVRHERQVHWDAGEVLVEDTLGGELRGAIDSRLVVAPDLSLQATSSGAEEVEPEDGWVSERLFERLPTTIRVARKAPGEGELGWRVLRKVSS